MRIKITSSAGSYVFNDPTAEHLSLLDEPIEGLGVSSVRTSSGTRSGQHGGYVAAQFYDMRLIQLTGTLHGDTPELLEANRIALSTVVGVLNDTPLTVEITTTGGKSYTIECFLDSMATPINLSPLKAAFNLSLLAPDPIIYDTSVGSSLNFTINRVVPGGMLFSDESPVFGYSTYFTDGMSNAMVNNLGSVEIYPVITINGKTANPVITNNTTGDSFRMSGYSVPDGSETVIDMKAHTIKLNGGNVLGYWDTTSQWVSLVPGENEFSFTSDNPSDVSIAQGTYLPGVVGV